MSWDTSAIGLATFKRPRRVWGEVAVRRLGDVLRFLAGEREVETEPRLSEAVREAVRFWGDARLGGLRDLTADEGLTFRTVGERRGGEMPRRTGDELVYAVLRLGGEPYRLLGLRLAVLFFFLAGDFFLVTVAVLIAVKWSPCIPPAPNCEDRWWWLPGYWSSGRFWSA